MPALTRLQADDPGFAILGRKLRPEFSRSALEILSGPHSRFPHPVSSGTLSVNPMPGGKLFQSFDGFQGVFGHRSSLHDHVG
jgi:hypothetical protein